MNVKKPLIALLAVSSVGAIAIPAQAQVYVESYRYTVPPDEPPVRYAPAPAPVVREGHWAWNGNRYVWVEPARPSYYAFRTERDRDRDGVPNYADRDIDGDGVPNRLDRFPYDPDRS